ncbi:glycosyltransferase family 2 protein [Frigoribacterium sp. CFBP 8754]|uniref:glycosyltransferase family 2 protein n=1 Tax=unclassified Frigoribacterium TaxID=2627005 RepID=UPI0017861C03|nr:MULTISPECIES: glycosyltransferase family 2 protein [unclassified Frigoribacterium]MBD8658996.1 glycosyltransferase family 2 protein [Frigoribacterium sp. CFBP 8754]MBD8727291.1 glycosyltransferase family 2 protein [Frigoribacterium sp. CFBP 13707]
MTLALTLMIRDEADILPEWLAYHVAQGVDVLVVTDNGSTDGTREILEDFARTSSITVDLRHDPVHRKQQSATVTTMARDAYTVHGADWVVNADADEFLVARDRSLTLGEVFSRLDPAVRAFVVPVVNMVGPLAERGGGLHRLVWRDERDAAELHAIGLISHPSGNAIHVGDADVSVVQGNHLVTLAQGAVPDEALALEVLHFPWRSWEQYAHRVEIAGVAYESNPDVQPSPNHHGMRDFRRLRAGTLKAYWALRGVTSAEGAAGRFTRDDSLSTMLTEMGLSTTTPDHLLGESEVEGLKGAGRGLVERDDVITRLEAVEAAQAENVRLLEATIGRVSARVAALEGLANDRERALAEVRARRVVRYADAVGDRARALRDALGR